MVYGYSCGVGYGVVGYAHHKHRYVAEHKPQGVAIVDGQCEVVDDEYQAYYEHRGIVYVAIPR